MYLRLAGPEKERFSRICADTGSAGAVRRFRLKFQLHSASLGAGIPEVFGETIFRGDFNGGPAVNCYAKVVHIEVREKDFRVIERGNSPTVENPFRL